MEMILAAVAFMSVNWLSMVGAIVMILNGLIALFMLIPNAEPEATLQKVLDFVGKFSRK